MKLVTNFLEKIIKEDWTLSDFLLSQHSYHEFRRWSVEAIIEKYKNDPKAEVFSDEDKAALWHVLRGEATTQPGGISIAVKASELANEYAKTNKRAEILFRALEAWLARHWLNEEAHHEVAFTRLANLAGIEKISNDELIQHKQYFPADKIGRKLVLQACVETEVTISYSHMVKNSTNPLVREIFYFAQKDESQHRLYFISFAKAFLELGIVPNKDILSMAYSWIRPHGDTYSTERGNLSQREGYINWWETVDSNDTYSMNKRQYKNTHIHKQKEMSVFQLVKYIIGIDISNVDELKRAYFKSLSSRKIA